VTGHSKAHRIRSTRCWPISHLPAKLVIVLSHRRRGIRRPLRITARLGELCNASKVRRVYESVKSLVRQGKEAEYRATPTDKKVPIPQRKLALRAEILVLPALRKGADWAGMCDMKATVKWGQPRRLWASVTMARSRFFRNRPHGTSHRRAASLLQGRGRRTPDAREGALHLRKPVVNSLDGLREQPLAVGGHNGSMSEQFGRETDRWERGVDGGLTWT